MSDEKSESPFTVGLFVPEDAPYIRDLFLAVYGDQYPVRTYYDPKALAESCARREIIIMSARDPQGRVIGMTAIFRNSPYENIYESGSGLVFPEYRNYGITTRLMSRLFFEPEGLKGLPVEGIWGEAVANHDGIQKLIGRLGFVETGIEVDLMPSSAYDKEKSASGRVGSVVGFKTVKPSSHTVFLPRVYDAELRFLYEGLDDKRALESATEALPDVKTEFAKQVFDFASVARIFINRSGRDFEAAFDGFEKKLATENRLEIIQVWVRLAEPWNLEIVEALRKRGYFMGGLFPRWYDNDGFMLNKIMGRPNWEGLVLHTDRAKKIRDFIYADWEKTR